ncbi:zinc ribbon domain-containing protein [Nocardioides sambongensis]|uniref:zinc ribbon domain-containing protein n=1 Tax=Nocardioides sambongensis TaxID=2589074 RepID=UPI001E51395F|nr:C4-type zinc ribbon domain-containing protein [Nocardioides sambongensis]
MKAEPSAQLRLLELQEVDARVDQLRHQKANLPQTAEIAALTARRTETQGWIRDEQIKVDDLTAVQEQADRDVEQVKARRKRDQDRIDAGLIGNPKDLERMQHELESLDRRISTLEDEELEVMERLEQAQTGLAQLRSDLDEVDRQLDALTTEREEQTAALEERIGETGERRAPIVAAIPDDLLALYEKLRTTRNGVGAALLRARRCGACMLTLDAAELAAIRGRAADDVVRCEECSRILVRNEESGL